jgi:hypothetical protein
MLSPFSEQQSKLQKQDNIVAHIVKARTVKPAERTVAE